MNKTKKGGIALIAIFLALVISPGVALSEAYATSNSYDKTVMIMEFLLHPIQLTSQKAIPLYSSM